MSVVTLPFESSPLRNNKKHSPALTIEGSAQISFVNVNHVTKLGKLYYTDPLKVLFPRPEIGDPITAVILTIGGGYLGGDRYSIDITVEEGAQALVTTQAAEKVYRSNGSVCHVELNLNVASQAQLEYFPLETIVYNHAHFRRTTRVNAAKDSTALVGEIVVFGRLASGEQFTSGIFRDVWEVKRNNRLQWVDALHLDEHSLKAFHYLSGFDGAKAIATILFLAEDAETYLDFARSLQDGHESIRASATVVNGLLLCRWLSNDPLALRQSVIKFLSRFRKESMGRPPTLPKLWYC